ncbi:Methyltransferase domain-containing protein [Terribacillus aidingensis]|uniref:Methyltransferase domain-containing protein n=1 Tax=Terribacillus aidingensis TaxID=586416 RepID=A0A285N0I1_9BACI|nr:methyltransferase domain-containing protein [Terribacillus aidingensis]SNZ02965.1 Methyltransferase domain-containing protein [Terribacillus aidingensis]
MDPKLQKKINKLNSIERVPAEEMFELLSIKESDNILDLGAGTGYISLAIAKLVNTVYAFDMDENILAYLGTQAKDRGISNVQTIAGDFREIPLDDKLVNIAFASISLHEVQPLSTALKEINRVLEDKGLLLCIDFEETASTSGRRVSSKDMAAEMQNAGFTIVDKILPTTKIMNQPVYIILAQN